jgi:predicted PurR-regulated permease PerM
VPAGYSAGVSARRSRRDGAPTRVGRIAWAVVGVLLVLLALAKVVAAVSLVVTAFVLALFPAAVLAPAATWLKARGVPAALAALLLVVGLVGSVVAMVRLLVPRFAAELPDLADTASQGLQTLRQWLEDSALPVDLRQVEDAARRAVEQVASGDLVGRGLDAAMVVVDVVTGTVLALVVLFFVLKDGERLWVGVADLLPERARAHADAVARRVWWTLGAYLRGQLLVALFDAVFIGLGLWLLGVPLPLSLAVLVLIGALFPIVGAFVSGLLAVLVALAANGLTTALLVLLLIVAVQQVEGNLLQPIILSKVIALHPLLIILSITAGALALGVLGAFLAVPLTASAARIVDYVRGRQPDAGPGSDGEPEDVSRRDDPAPAAPDPAPPSGRT